MDTKSLVAPFYVDSPLKISLNTDSGELTVKSYNFLSDGGQMEFQIQFSPQATQEMIQALAVFQEKIDIGALLNAKPHTAQ